MFFKYTKLFGSNCPAEGNNYTENGKRKATVKEPVAMIIFLDSTYYSSVFSSTVASVAALYLSLYFW